MSRGKPREALHSFQFRHVSGLVEVVKGDVVAYDHPAVGKHPDWFRTTDEAPDTGASVVDPVDGESNPEDGEE